VEGEGEEGDAGEDDEDGGHVGEERSRARVGPPRGVAGGWRQRRRPPGRRGRGVVRRGRRGGVVTPVRHGARSLP
jgi:hypothetical protein